MQQSNRMMNVSSSSRMLMESQMNKGSRSQLEEIMQQATMRKNNSSIQILQRVVSNKENNRETMNMNLNNNIDSLKIKDRQQSLMNDKKIAVKNIGRMQPQQNNRNQLTQQQKMQQLKNRFRKIKCSYQQNHNNIMNNSVGECQQNNYSMGSNQTTRFGETTQFDISQHQLTYMDNNRQSRRKADFSFLSKQNNEISFQKDSSFVQTDRRQCSFGQYNNSNNLNNSNNSNNSNNLNDRELKDKYRSLTKELQTFQQKQLIDLLIEEIEDNQKNKHSTQKYKQQMQSYKVQIESFKALLENTSRQNQQYKKQLQFNKVQIQRLTTLINNKDQLSISNNNNKNTSQRQTIRQVQKLRVQVQKLKKQLDSKREQVEILLQTEKKNLNIIQKLKKNNKINNNNLINNNNSNQSNLLERRQSSSMTLAESKCRQLPTTINAVNNNINSNNHNNTSDKSLIMSLITQNQNTIDQKLKHDQLQQYMHEYINNVNMAYQEYKKNITQLKQANSTLRDTCNKLRQQLFILKGNNSKQEQSSRSKLNKVDTNNRNHQEYNNNEKIQQLINNNKYLQQQVISLKTQIQRLTTCISNSKLVISELEQQFILLKDQNTQLRTIINQKNQQLFNKCQQLQRSKQQQQIIAHHLQKLQNKIQKQQKQLNLLSNSNQRLLNQNQQLIKDITQIQSKIISNSQTQSQIRSIIQELTSKKLKQQNQIQQQLKSINQLKNTLKSKISGMKQLEEQIQLLRNTLQGKQRQQINKLSQMNNLQKQLSIKQNQLNIKQNQLTQLRKQLNSNYHNTNKLTHRLQLVTKSNNILQQTICEMTQLITELLSQHKQQKQHQTQLKQQLQSIMQNVKTIQSAYQWQATHKQLIQQMLTLFWERENQSNQSNQSIQFNLSNPNNQSKISINKIISRNSLQNPKFQPNLYNFNQQNEQQSGQISFKKCSQMTKQGSSSVFNKISQNQQNKSYSKSSSSWKNSQMNSSIVDSSAISHKYYSETQQDLTDNHSFNILKNSNVPNLISCNDINFYDKINKKSFDKKSK